MTYAFRFAQALGSAPKTGLMPQKQVKIGSLIGAHSSFGTIPRVQLLQLSSIPPHNSSVELVELRLYFENNLQFCHLAGSLDTCYLV